MCIQALEWNKFISEIMKMVSHNSLLYSFDDLCCKRLLTLYKSHMDIWCVKLYNCFVTKYHCFVTITAIRCLLYHFLKLFHPKNNVFPLCCRSLVNVCFFLRVITSLSIIDFNYTCN